MNVFSRLPNKMNEVGLKVMSSQPVVSGRKWRNVSLKARSSTNKPKSSVVHQKHGVVWMYAVLHTVIGVIMHQGITCITRLHVLLMCLQYDVYWRDGDASQLCPNMECITQSIAWLMCDVFRMCHSHCGRLAKGSKTAWVTTRIARFNLPPHSCISKTMYNSCSHRCSIVKCVAWRQEWSHYQPLHLVPAITK